VGRADDGLGTLQLLTGSRTGGAGADGAGIAMVSFVLSWTSLRNSGRDVGLAGDGGCGPLTVEQAVVVATLGMSLVSYRHLVENRGFGVGGVVGGRAGRCRR